MNAMIMTGQVNMTAFHLRPRYNAPFGGIMPHYLTGTHVQSIKTRPRAHKNPLTISCRSAYFFADRTDGGLPPFQAGIRFQADDQRTAEGGDKIIPDPHRCAIQPMGCAGRSIVKPTPGSVFV